MDWYFPMYIINSVIQELSEKYRDSHNILFINEVYPAKDTAKGSQNSKISDWSTFNPQTSNVDYFISLSPQGFHFEKDYIVNPPLQTALSTQLFERHRHSTEMKTLLQHFYCSGDTTYLDPSKDVTIEESKLPSGRLPIWIIKGANISDEKVFEDIKTNHIHENETVMLIYDKHALEQKHIENILEICTQNKWRCYDFGCINGAECHCIIIYDLIPDPEMIASARNGMVLVTNER